MKQQIEQYIFAVESLQGSDLTDSVMHVRNLSERVHGAKHMAGGTASMELGIAAVNLANVCRLGGRTEHAVEQLGFALKHLRAALAAVEESASEAA